VIGADPIPAVTVIVTGQRGRAAEEQPRKMRLSASGLARACLPLLLMVAVASARIHKLDIRVGYGSVDIAPSRMTRDAAINAA
jgi:hypothetical protein